MRIAILCLVLILCASPAPAQTTNAVTADDPTAAISALRGELVDSFNKGDLARLLSHLDADVVITWQNGEVTRGPDEVKAYYDKMMTGPDRRVESVTADPKVTDRHVYGDWAVSWGRMNDRFVLIDGTPLDMDSRFTATIARRGEVWKVTSFHLSANLFDNPVLGYAAKRAAIWSGVVGAVVGIVLGVVVCRLFKRKAA